MNYIEKFKEQTRWNDIPQAHEAYRLLCADPECSLSCANLKDGKISVTSVHGTMRHSYEFTKKDMLFTVLKFFNSLSEKDLETAIAMLNRSANNFYLELETK